MPARHESTPLKLMVYRHEKSSGHLRARSLGIKLSTGEADALIQLRVIFKTLAPGLRLGAP